MPQSPNILYVFTDQQTAGAMSCAGNGDLRTAAMDRLAAEGVRFDRAYCAQPLCTPSRASMLTGLMPHQAGAPRNEMAIAEPLRRREMGTILAAAGYECAYGGKWHVPGLTIQEGHGFRKISPSVSQRPNLDGGDDHLVEACPALPANFAVPPHEPQAIRFEQAANSAIYPTAQYTPEDWRRYRWAYCRLVEKVDGLIGQVLDVLAGRGLEDRTLVVFSSDHGDGLGAHQWSQKCVLYEEPIHVPLIVRAPGIGPKGFVDRQHLVSNGLDLLPTFCDYAGIEPPPGLEGSSLRPLIEGAPCPVWRDGLVVETVFDGDRGGATAGRMVRTDKYKYIVYNWGECREQLFDLERDPGELANLAAFPSHADVLEDHRRRLHAWSERTGDDARQWLLPADAH